jgi:hypothetical protein
MTPHLLRPLLEQMGYQHIEQKGIQTWVKVLPKHEVRTRIVLKEDKLHVDVDRLSLMTPLAPSLSLMSATWEVSKNEGEVVAVLAQASLSGEVLSPTTSNEELVSHFSRYIFSAQGQPSFEGMGDSLLKQAQKNKLHV